MEIKQIVQNDDITLAVIGRLDTITAPQLEAAIKELVNPKNIILDFDNLEYISSAGLRVVLGISKMMKDAGTFKIINVNADVYEVFEMTGFLDIVNVEKK